jgi:hypothetical protein
MQIRSPTSKRKVESSAATMGVYYEQRRIGHVRERSDQRFEAYDHTKRSLGIFETEDEAATAIWKAAHSVMAERNTAADISHCRCHSCRAGDCWPNED